MKIVNIRTILLVCTLLTIVIAKLDTEWTGFQANKFSSHNDDKCFCKLKGEVDDCSCKVETLDSLNNKKIFPRLKSLLSKDYFRYFKVNLKKDCPFWTDDSRCAMKDCHVDTCSEDQVPEALKLQEINKYTKEAQGEESCDEERKLSALDTTISNKSKEAFQNWTRHDDLQDSFCETDDENSANLDYVDLRLNPERYTGYKGASPHRIWSSIYEENCFKPQVGYGYGPNNRIAKLPFEDMCLEKRVFYRMISGLHTSINIHLSAEYLHTGIEFGGDKWGPNVSEFKTRFDPSTSDGQGPQRLKNLYFTYLVELRALAKVAPYLANVKFFTGNTDDDNDTRKGVTDFLAVVRSFEDHFDESKLFAGKSKVARKLKEEFRQHFLNVTRIMDCVGCDKCRLWGKLQVLGMGTALKILFSGNSVGPKSVVDASSKNFQLTRTEIVALFNGFGRLSTSVHSLEVFRKLMS